MQKGGSIKIFIFLQTVGGRVSGKERMGVYGL